MTKKNVYGIVSIIAGVFLFLPLLFYFGAAVVKVAGFKISSEGITFLQAIENIGNAEGIWDTLVSISSIVTIVAAVALIVFGILLLTTKTNKLTKFSRIVSIVAGAIALVTAVFAIINVANEKTITEEAFGIIMTQDAVIGFGTIFLALMGIATIVWGCLLHLVKDCSEPAKKAVTATETKTEKPAASKPVAAEKPAVSKTTASKPAAAAKPAASKTATAKKTAVKK